MASKIIFYFDENKIQTKQIGIFREQATSVFAGFHAGPLSWSNWNLIGAVGFCGGRKTGEPGEKPSEQGENQQQTQPTYDTGQELNLGHIGVSRSLSSLRHPCSLTIEL